MSHDNEGQLEIGWTSISSFLQPRYRNLLRFHRKRPHLLRVGGNLSLLVCFAVCLCAAAYMNRLVDEIINESMSSEGSGEANLSLRYKNGKNRISARLLKIVLENRGVDSKQFWDRSDLMEVIKMTGDLKKEELLAAELSLERGKHFDVDTYPDTVLHRQLVSVADMSHSYNSAPVHGSVDGARSIVFDHEAEFIERVDDNKDSLWLLGVIAVRPGLISEHVDDHTGLDGGTLEDHVWGSLVNRYHPFGFKMGLLNCHRLRSICIDRGFMAADLVLALPRGGDRMKDSVQFRPYPRLFRPRGTHHKRSSTNWSTDQTLQAIHIWLLSLLGERVRQTRSIEDILPGSMTFAGSASEPLNMKMQWLTWSRRRPQPLHLIWLPSEPSSHQTLQFDYTLPPLSLSALSVPYTGRVRFWILTPNQLHKNLFVQRTKGSDAFTFNDLFTILGCPTNSTYLLVSPEAGCYNFGSLKSEYLGYRALEMFLCFFYPSVDDCLLCVFIVVNLIAILNTGVTVGTLFARQTAMDSYRASPTHRNRPISTRRRLAITLMHFARRGWTSHTPPTVTNDSGQSTANLTGSQTERHRGDTVLLSNSFAYSSAYTLTASKFWFEFAKELSMSVLRDIISVNLVLLLTILPLINLLGLPSLSPLVNVCLSFIRSFSSMPSVVIIRLAIVSGKMNWTIFLWLGFIFWLGMAALSVYAQRVLSILDRSSYSSSNRSRRYATHGFPPSFVHCLNSASPNAFWDELTRLLLTSDVDTFTNRTTNTCTSSSSEADSVNHQSFGNRPNAFNNTEFDAANGSLEGQERTRLLRRIRRLHQLLHSESVYLNSPPANVPVSDMDFQSSAQPESDFLTNQRVSSAHIFTWKCSIKRCVQATRKQTQNNPDTIQSSEKTDLTDDFNLERNDQTGRLLDAGYEAEDEQDNFGIDVRKQFRRLRFRRPCFRRPPLPFPRSSHSDSSDTLSESNSDPEQAVVNEHGRFLPDESNKMDKLNWPLWVIPCKDCVVCWRTFRPGVRLGALPCGHGFHEACIRRWLDTGALDCPVCRWPAYAPHLRQQRQMIGQLLHAVHSNIGDVGNPD